MKFDVVVVGGGIAGSTLATVLAREGLETLVLERQEQFQDRVRGEYLVPWGVQEAERLELDEVLLAAGGHCAHPTSPAPTSAHRSDVQTLPASTTGSPSGRHATDAIVSTSPDRLGQVDRVPPAATKAFIDSVRATAPSATDDTDRRPAPRRRRR